MFFDFENLYSINIRMARVIVHMTYMTCPLDMTAITKNSARNGLIQCTLVSYRHAISRKSAYNRLSQIISAYPGHDFLLIMSNSSACKMPVKIYNRLIFVCAILIHFKSETFRSAQFMIHVELLNVFLCVSESFTLLISTISFDLILLLLQTI